MEGVVLLFWIDKLMMAFALFLWSVSVISYLLLTLTVSQEIGINKDAFDYPGDLCQDRLLIIWID